MKGIRSLFRLGALGMVAVLLVVALTVPAAAADQTCKEDQMLDEVVILSVNPQESTYTWDASELLSYGDGAAGTYPTGQLEIQFNDINTAHRITHYDVIATPSDEPGTSDALGIKEVTTQVNRPGDVGSVVTATLDLEPGTNYDIDVVAFYYSVQISPNQSNQDSLGGTTFLSPPFLGGGTEGVAAMTQRTEAPSDRGVHFLVYKADEELHTLSWLNPTVFGPFDHTWKEPNKKGADILCTDDDGDLVGDCAAKDVEGVTHYRVTVIDDDGNTEYVDTIRKHGDAVYKSEFNLNDGTYTFAVDGGYEDGGKFYALSDKAQVEFDIPDDYRKYNQDAVEINALVDEILGTVSKKDQEDHDPFYDSVWDYRNLGWDKIIVAAVIPDDVSDVDAIADLNDAAAVKDRERALAVYLNNLYN